MDSWSSVLWRARTMFTDVETVHYCAVLALCCSCFHCRTVEGLGSLLGFVHEAHPPLLPSKFELEAAVVRVRTVCVVMLVVSIANNDIFLNLPGLRIRGWRSKGRILGGFRVSHSWVVTTSISKFIGEDYTDSLQRVRRHRPPSRRVMVTRGCIPLLRHSVVFISVESHDAGVEEQEDTKMISVRVKLLEADGESAVNSLERDLQRSQDVGFENGREDSAIYI
ncbi:hypothetical protein Taro_021004 [Colocasia esculenta]|uniref:Uncharacterized protein n=1 Tax=Colocasia esculenta TaxID=4460 RepID=A0A843V431_COLES|nr:hypothetical protein [Colocasia esculenta]